MTVFKKLNIHYGITAPVIWESRDLWVLFDLFCLKNRFMAKKII